MTALQNIYQSAASWLDEKLIQQKLHNPLGAFLLGGIAIFTSIVFVLLGLKLGMLYTGLIIGLFVAVLCFVDLNIGLLTALVAAFFVNYVTKMIDAPIGLLLDALLGLLLLSFIVQIVFKRDYKFPKSAISYVVLVWVGYNLLQAINPIAPSRVAWGYTVRSFSIMYLFFFIAAYSIRTKKQVFFFVNAIVGLCLFSAIYGVKQEFLGYSQMEWRWLYANPDDLTRIKQWNRYRVFSIFSDPTTFGTAMSYCGILSFLLATGPYKAWLKIGYIISGVLMFMSMFYAGSRTPIFIVPAAIILYMILIMKREHLLIIFAIFALGAASMIKSTNNPIIYRIQSAFQPAKDAAVHVRLENQRKIQPFIQTTPFGAGLGSTGIWGERFSPEHWLAGFAHDSAFVRVAVEMGWVGLVIYMSMLFIVFRTALRNYLLAEDPKIKNMYLGFATIIFLISIASYPQEIITLLPHSIIFYILLACIINLIKFDDDHKVVTINPTEK